MRTILTALFLILLVGQVSADDYLPRDEQVSIIADYMLVTGQGGLSYNATSDKSDDRPPIKCGTPAILNFITHYDRLDPELLKSLGVQVISRPTYLTDSVDSPKGLFRIHYLTTGLDALEGGTPTAVKIADIMDSVYAHIVGTLGFPPPPQDGYEEGGDEKYDVYMRYLGSSYYGMTWADSLDYPEFQQATSYIEMNANPSSLPGYSDWSSDRPMDAIRVTAAHEFFHAVQFGIDWRETEDLGSETLDRRYWMEMSAVWMEEEIYDHINDYYSYLPYFYNIPEASLQQFATSTDLHPYASVVYPIFLSEKFGRDIIRDIWLLCGSMEPGPSFLRAADSAIFLASDSIENWETAFSEFALWNYLTGERSDLSIKYGHDNSQVVGYSEREEYPAIPFDKLHPYFKYPVVVVSNNNRAESPRVNGSYYMTLNELASATVLYDTVTFVCDSGAGEFPNCTDSTQTRDTTYITEWRYSFITHIDTFFNIYLALGDGDYVVPTLPEPWGLNMIYQFEQEPDSLVVDRFFAPDDGIYKIDLLDHTEYRSLTLILTPGSSSRAFYEDSRYRIMMVGYAIGENSVLDTLVNIPAAVLDLYPNPVIAAEMDQPRVTFLFQVGTDSTSFPEYGWPYVEEPATLQVDIYTVAGERVRTIAREDRQEDDRSSEWRRSGKWFAEWDLTNESGADIASGVYLVYARLYSQAKRGVLLAEDHSKVLVIR